MKDKIIHILSNKIKNKLNKFIKVNNVNEIIKIFKK
jgi:hypothetical protein